MNQYTLISQRLQAVPRTIGLNERNSSPKFNLAVAQTPCSRDRLTIIDAFKVNCDHDVATLIEDVGAIERHGSAHPAWHVIPNAFITMRQFLAANCAPFGLTRRGSLLSLSIDRRRSIVSVRIVYRSIIRSAQWDIVYQISPMGHRERRQDCPVADIKLLKNVMEMNLDGAVGDVQPPTDFLV